MKRLERLCFQRMILKMYRVCQAQDKKGKAGPQISRNRAHLWRSYAPLLTGGIYLLGTERLFSRERNGRATMSCIRITALGFSWFCKAIDQRKGGRGEEK